MVWHGFQTIIYVRKIWNNLTSYYDRRLPSSRWESWWRSWLWPGTERQSQRTTDDMTSSFRTRIWCLRPFFPIWLLRSFLSDSSKNSWLWFDRSSKLFRLLLEVLCIAVNRAANQLQGCIIHSILPSGMGARDEHGDVFLFSNLCALWFSENRVFVLTFVDV